MSLWTQKDDELLKELVGDGQKPNWELIAQKFKNFNSTMCLKRYRKIERIETKKGMWVEIEDNLLRNAIKLFGDSSWTQVACFVYGRNSKQCRERWNNQLNPNINRSPLTLEEEELLIRKQNELGNKWTAIAQFFEKRTDNMIKNAWHSLRMRRGLPNYSSPKKKNNKRRKNARKKKKIIVGKHKTQKKNKNENEMGMGMEIETGKNKELDNQQTENRNQQLINNKGYKSTKKNNYKNKFKRGNLRIEINNNSKSIPNERKTSNKKFTNITLKKLNLINNHNKFNFSDNIKNNQINYSDNEFYSPQSPREHIISPKINPIQDVSFKIRKLNLSTQNTTASSSSSSSAKNKYPLSARSTRIKNFPISPRSKNYQLSPRSSRKSPRLSKKSPRLSKKSRHFQRKKSKKKKKKKKIVVSPRRNRLISQQFQFQKNNLTSENETTKKIIDNLFPKENNRKNELKIKNELLEKTTNIIFNNINDISNSNNNSKNNFNKHYQNNNGNDSENNKNLNEKQKLNITNLDHKQKENTLKKKQIFDINNNEKKFYSG
ncbi:snRNA-activating protein complex subunit [Anaeramoeba flamelloides]|uniref:snRNA-activating protein complex subunit n=1 Tax=Anaeramoeba flamelloides TaxID=1746091 RepID=A0AAV7ZCE4_9EUKA|nr:snRNA-activating protein complex subunit [Anaeramoeba flamelloides]